jgi:hypothetical protein
MGQDGVRAKLPASHQWFILSKGHNGDDGNRRLGTSMHFHVKQESCPA